MDTKIVEIYSIKHLNNSVNGNPRYRITFSGAESAVTQTDAGFAYAIYDGYVGKMAKLTFSRAGYITDIEILGDPPLSEEEYDRVDREIKRRKEED